MRLTRVLEMLGFIFMGICVGIVALMFLAWMFVKFAYCKLMGIQPKKWDC